VAIQDGELKLPALRPTLDMLANIAFPYPVNELLSAASEITANPDKPLAHILRVADVYDTLRRTGAGQMEEDALFDQMRRLPSGTLHAEVLETFIHMRKQERAISAMNIFWAAILLVDPRPEELQLLRLRLENDDYHVLAAKSVEEALQIVRTEKITLVLTERLLSGNSDGFELLRALKSDPDLARIPVVFHAPANTDQIKQALEQGAEDWLIKPHNVEIIAMKLHRIVSRLHVDPAASHDGVQGNIRDMGIIELIQVLSVGCRSVQILLTQGKTLAELSLQRGQIISATAGQLEGEAAALEILGWDEGQFRILPLKQTPPVTIRASTDTLLLQACYRKDQQATTHD
jgi:CheY-like chemotaxis protein